MRRAVDAEFVISCIYEALSDPGVWNTALDAVRPMFQADAVMLVYGNLSAADFRVVGATGFDPDALSAFTGNILSGDELIRQSMGGPAAVIVSSGRSFRGKSFFRTSLYRRLLQPSDLAHIAGAAAVNTGEAHASVWLARSERSPDFSADDTNALRALLPHFSRVMTVYHRIRRAELRTEMVEGAFDRLAVGVVLLDAKGAPVMVNREAERLAARKDGFVLKIDGLAADRINDTKKLRELIRRVGSGGSADHGAGAGTVRLVRPSGLPDFHIVALPLPKRCQSNGGGGAAAVLFVTDPEKPQGLVDSLLGDLYGLTDAEVRLVTRLLEGGGLTVAAEKLGLSRNTVHSQLASVFLKTNTRSQSELVTLLLTCVAPVEPPDETSGFHLPAFSPRNIRE